MLELIVEKNIDIKLKRDIFQEVLMVIVFIFANWCIGGIIGLMIYLVIYVLYIGFNRKDIKGTLLFVKEKMFN